MPSLGLSAPAPTKTHKLEREREREREGEREREKQTERKHNLHHSNMPGTVCLGTPEITNSSKWLITSFGRRNVSNSTVMYFVCAFACVCVSLLTHKTPFGDLNASGQPGHIAVHTCVCHSPRSPADHLCSDAVTAYVTSTRRSRAPAEKTKMFPELIHKYRFFQLLTLVGQKVICDLRTSTGQQK